MLGLQTPVPSFLQLFFRRWLCCTLKLPCAVSFAMFLLQTCTSWMPACASAALQAPLTVINWETTAALSELERFSRAVISPAFLGPQFQYRKTLRPEWWETLTAVWNVVWQRNLLTNALGWCLWREVCNQRCDLLILPEGRRCSPVIYWNPLQDLIGRFWYTTKTNMPPRVRHVQ